MDEKSLYCLRRTPPEEFVRRLQASLPLQDAMGPVGPRRPGKLVAIAAGAMVVAGAFSIPAVRATAQAFLDLFRVVHFVGVPLDREATQRLLGTDLNLPQLLGDQIQWLQKPQPAKPYATPDAASAAAGFRIQLPAWMPVGWDKETPSVVIRGATAARLVANTERLGQILASLGIDDVSVPDNLNGRSATLRVSPTVFVKWVHAGSTVELVQSPSPEVEFPTGTDLAPLAQIGLRILGLSKEDAYRFAQSIDWRTTLVVPIPVNTVAYSQVTVQGSSGLLLEQVGPPGPQRRAGRMVLWSRDKRVFALRGNLPAADLLEMAETLQ